MSPLAIIFDMDGVLADTEGIHATAGCNVLRQYGIEFSPADLSKHYAGMPESVIWPGVFKKYGKKMPPIKTLIDEKFAAFNAMVRDGIPEMPGVQNLIKALKKENIRIAVASGAGPQYIELILSGLKLKTLFDAITASTEVTHGKPSPDIFLLAAKKLSIEPKHCIVIEDARSGTLAAKAAGMKCIGVRYPGNQQDLSAATKIVESLEEVDMEMLKRIGK